MIDSQAFKDLIKALRDEGLIKNQRDLADKLGVHEQIITDAKTKENKDRSDLVLAIKEAFPEFSLTKFLDKKSSKRLENLQEVRQSLKSIDQEGIPYYDLDVSAGPTEMFNDGYEEPTGRIIIPGLQECDFSIKVWGDSMYPEYKNGDMILCKEIRDKSIIAYGEAYLVVTNELRTLKFIQKGSSANTVTLRSENEKFDPFEVPRDAIRRLYLVMAKVRRNAI